MSSSSTNSLVPSDDKLIVDEKDENIMDGDENLNLDGNDQSDHVQNGSKNISSSEMNEYKDEEKKSSEIAYSINDDEEFDRENEQKEIVEEINDENPSNSVTSEDKKDCDLSQSPSGKDETEETEETEEEPSISDSDRIRQLEEELSMAVAQLISIKEERNNAEDKQLNGNIELNNYKKTVEEMEDKFQKQLIIQAETVHELQKIQTKYASLEQQYGTAMSEKTRFESEISKLRSSQQDLETKEIVHKNRINESKKKESLVSRENVRLESLNNSLEEQNTKLETDLNKALSEKEKLETTLAKVKKKCLERIKSLEQSLQEERNLNEERKKKMKVFVENKANELRIAKQHKDEHFHELNECRQKLKSTRNQLQEQIELVLQKDKRISDVHGQLSRFKRDNERYLKLGDTLNQELVQSKEESERHQKKRSLAKNELMSILKKLELEQSVSGKLRDGLKFTFTPKALSQQQLLQEGIESMEIQIGALAKKIGKPVPPTPADVIAYLHPSTDNNSTHNGTSSSNTSFTSGSLKSKLETDANRLLSNLESETQRVSQGIMALQSSLEQLNFLISSDRGPSCLRFIYDFIAQYNAKRYSRQQQHDHEQEHHQTMQMSQFRIDDDNDQENSNEII